MKKIHVLLLLVLIPIVCKAQFFGLGGQYATGADGQFAINASFPTYFKENPLNLIVSNGLEYTTSGGARISGLNLKPLQIQSYLSEDLYNNHAVTFLVGVDGGYLFDFRAHHKNGIIITPNIYMDYKILFLKAGYDFDVRNGKNQFFVRAGVGIGLGIFKSFAKTRIR